MTGDRVNPRTDQDFSNFLLQNSKYESIMLSSYFAAFLLHIKQLCKSSYCRLHCFSVKQNMKGCVVHLIFYFSLQLADNLAQIEFKNSKSDISLFGCCHLLKFLHKNKIKLFIKWKSNRPSNASIIRKIFPTQHASILVPLHLK